MTTRTPAAALAAAVSRKPNKYGNLHVMNTELARQQMVEQQVRTWDVTSPEVLAVFGEVEREQFVPPGFEAVAYADTEIPLGHGQVMLRPTLEGRILQELAVQKHERVLDVGTGSGYLAACLSRRADEVISIDIYEDFLAAATGRLMDDGISNVKLSAMDAMAELPEGDFDVIVITGSLPSLDQRFTDALRPGGRLFVVTGESPVMNALVVTRDGDELVQEIVFETDIPALVNVARPTGFFF